MTLGTFGPITFHASEKSIRNFDRLRRTEGSRWSKHNIVGRKPKNEFVGPDLGTISLIMRFDVMYGMHPRREMDELLKIARSGEVHTLIIGGKGLGMKKWSIKKITQNWNHLDNEGNLLVGEANIELEEYL